MIELVSDIVYCITAVRQPLLKENLGFFLFLRDPISTSICFDCYSPFIFFHINSRFAIVKYLKLDLSRHLKSFKVPGPREKKPCQFPTLYN